jgi:TM2 domain-containing membrane protein YozV
MKSEKNGNITAYLAIILGFAGVHRFYVGKIGTGILMLFSFGGLFIWWAIDVIMVVLDKFKDKKGQTIKVGVIDGIAEIVGYETEAAKLKVRAQYVGLPEDATLQEVEAAEEERRRNLIKKYGKEDGIMIFQGKISESEYLDKYHICPKCNKGTKEHEKDEIIRQVYRHQTKDGKRDSRYTNNTLYSTHVYTISCRHCSHSFSDEVTV